MPEAAGGVDVGVDGFRTQVLRFELARPSFHYNLAEGVPVEGGGVAFVAAALAGVFVVPVPGTLHPVVARVLGVYGMQDFNLRALGSLDAVEVHSAGDVVAEIDLPGAVFLSGYALGLTDLHNAVFQALLTFKCTLRSLAYDSRLPFLFVLLAGVVCLSAVDVII